MTVSRTAIAIPIMIRMSCRSLRFMERIQARGDGGTPTTPSEGKVGRGRPGCPLAT